MTRLEKAKAKFASDKVAKREAHLKENINRGVLSQSGRWADYNSISIKRYSDLPVKQYERLEITVTFVSKSAVVFSIEQSEYTFHMKKPGGKGKQEFWNIVEVGDVFSIYYIIIKKSRSEASTVCVV